MSNLSTKLAGDNVLSKSPLIDLNKRLFEYTGAEFLQLLKDSQLTPELPSVLERTRKYVNDTEARRILSGNPDKPISNPTFNKLRREGKITTYFPSPGRVAFDNDEINQYIATQGKEKTVLKRKNR